MFSVSILSALVPALLIGAPAHAAAHMHGSITGAPASIVTGAIGFPHIPMPKFRIPRRSKRDAANAPLALIDRRLRLLVSQEERWYATNARYGADVAQVARPELASDSLLGQVQVQVLYATKRGWTAIAAHPAAPGKTCVVFVGYRDQLPLVPRTRAEALEATDEGRPVCDR